MATEFQERVYAALRGVPRGRVTTYGLLAAHLGVHSPRAVGQALRRNPYAPAVPCHRVIAGTLDPGGFQGRRTGRAVRRKLALLAAEGVRFRNGRLTEPDRLFLFDAPAERAGQCISVEQEPMAGR